MRIPSLGIGRSSALSRLRDLESASAELGSSAKHNAAIKPKLSKMLWPEFVRFVRIDFPEAQSN
jgi:hypothetical protein